MNDRIVPAIPNRSTELAWVEARIGQLEFEYNSPFIGKVTLFTRSDLAEKLNEQISSDPKFSIRWRGTEFVIFPMDLINGGEISFDEHKYSLDLSDENGYLIASAFGLAYPTPMTKEHIEMRWTFDVIDGMSCADAEQAAANMLR